MIDTPASSERLLGIPSFRWLWCAHLVSMFGDGLYNVALPWLAWEHTHSGFATAATLATSSFAFLVVGPFAGVYVDRWDHRRTLIGADLLRAATLTIVPLILLWRFNLGVALVLALLVPAFSRFFTPAQRSLVPALVDGKRLVAANALMQGAGSVAFIAGPAAAGLLLTVLGGVPLLLLDGLTFLASAAFLSLIASPQRPALQPPPDGRCSVRADLAHGFRVTWNIPGLRASALLAIGLTVCLAPVSPLVPMWLSGTGSGTARAFGLLNASLFAGSLAGSAFMTSYGRRLPRGSVISVSVTVMGIAITGFAAVHQVMIGVLALATIGVVLSTYNVGIMTLLQQLAPSESMGRVFAVNETFSWSLRWVAILTAGALATGFGVHKVLAGLGVGMLAMGCLAATIRAFHASRIGPQFDVALRR